MENKVSKTYSLDPEIVEAVEKIASNEDRTPSSMANILLRLAIEQWNKDNETTN